MISSTRPRRSRHHPNRHQAALSSPQAPPPLRPRRSNCRPKRQDGEDPSHRERTAPPSGPTSTSHSRSVHFDVKEDPTEYIADKVHTITICMLVDAGSSIPSESQSRGSGSSWDSSVNCSPSGDAPILFEAVRGIKGRSVEPRISTSGGWKSEDSELISSQHTLKEATPSSERSVPCKTVSRTYADNETE